MPPRKNMPPTFTRRHRTKKSICDAENGTHWATTMSLGGRTVNASVLKTNEPFAGEPVVLSQPLLVLPALYQVFQPVVSDSNSPLTTRFTADAGTLATANSIARKRGTCRRMPLRRFFSRRL